MAITQYYVDPAIAADSGTGTIGDPFGDVQYALNNITRDGTSGDQINVKAGTDEVLAAALTLATYGTPSTAAPLVIRGYTSAANDGGIGGISGNATYAMFAGAYASVHLIDMHLHNSGSANLLVLGNTCSVIRCEIDNSSGTGPCKLGLSSVFLGCYIHNVGGWIEPGSRGGNILSCWIEAGPTNAPVAPSALVRLDDGSAATGNVIVCNSNANGISIQNDIAFVTNNTIYGAAGTGTGVACSSSYTTVITNNIIEGFSGAGGVGVGVGGSPSLIRNNAFYNNTTNIADTGDEINSADNTALGASPFVNAAAGDFDIDGTVTGVTEAAWPTSWPGLTTDTTPKADLGAVQAGAGAAASSIYRRVARILGG